MNAEFTVETSSNNSLHKALFERRNIQSISVSYQDHKNQAKNLNRGNLMNTVCFLRSQRWIVIPSPIPKIKDQETLLFPLRKDKEEMSPKFRDHSYPETMAGIPFWSGSHGEVVSVVSDKAWGREREKCSSSSFLMPLNILTLASINQKYGEANSNLASKSWLPI